jgi:hypothetical protein
LAGLPALASEAHLQGNIMISKDVAEKIHRSALNSIVELGALLQDVSGTCSEADFETIKKGVGISIGTIQTLVMDPLYVDYPELDDLK